MKMLIIVVLVAFGLSTVAQKTNELNFILTQAQIGLLTTLNLTSGESKLSIYTEKNKLYLDIYNEYGFMHHGILSDVDSIESSQINSITEKEIEKSAIPLKTQLFHKKYSYSVTFLNKHEVRNEEDVNVSMIYIYHPEAIVFNCIIHLSTGNQEIYTGYLNNKK